MISTNFSTETTGPALPGKQIWRTVELDTRSSLAITVTTLLLLLLSLPVILLMIPVKYYDQTTLTELFRMLAAIPFFTFSVLALALNAGRMFAYLHQKAAVDVYHALPVRRPTLFAGRFLAGFLQVGIPQIVAFGLVLLIRFLPGYRILDLAAVLATAGSFLLGSLAFYAVAVLAFVLTGRMFDAMFLLLMFNAAWPGVLYAIDWFLGQILPGFTQGNYASLTEIGRYLLFSPLGELLKVVFQPMGRFEIFWWVGMILLMGLGSLLFYRRRPSELAGQPMACRPPFLIVRFLACVAAGLFFGYLYYAIYATTAAFIFSAAVGSLAVHTLAEAAFSRGFRHFRASLVSYGIFAVLFTAGYLMAATGLMGYDTRLPAAEQIVQVRLDPNSDLVMYDQSDEYAGLIFNDPENIAVLREMHARWLDKMQTLVHKPYALNTNDYLHYYDQGRGSGPSRLIYRLSSGREIIRIVYFNYEEEPFASLYNRVRSTEEYQRQHYSMFFMPDSVLHDLSIEDKAGNELLALNADTGRDQMAGILSALRLDLLRNADQVEDSPFFCYLHLTVAFGFNGTADNQGFVSGRTMIRVTDAFTQTAAAVKQLNLAQPEPSAGDYAAVYITTTIEGDHAILDALKSNADAGAVFYQTDWYGSGLPRLNDPHYFAKVEDPALIEALFKGGQDAGTAEYDDYLALFVTAGQVDAEGSAAGPVLVLRVPDGPLAEAAAGLIGR